MTALIDYAKEYYEVLKDDSDDTKTAKIKIIKGEYKGIIYHYDVMKIKESDTEELMLTFSYDIDTMPKKIMLKEEKQIREFEQTIGDILVSFIISSEGEFVSSENMKK